MPRDRPWYVILPGSHRILWWDALVRWLAVFFFIQIPMDIAFRGQQRLARWYYISIQVTAVILYETVTTLQTPCSTSQPSRLLSSCCLKKCCRAVRVAQPDMLLIPAAAVQVLDCLLVIDVILHFFRAYPNKRSVLVVELSKIRRNYLGDCCIRQLHCIACSADGTHVS